ncbi:tripartite motif-containing protein 16-like protein [Paramisgurnus dabryanus]|uniref:tripartite motif-containing protein 16-like protein n=1 Tax=Paramisgurnus dabryanus TaxID=90735 RepID=UPI003CCF2415
MAEVRVSVELDQFKCPICLELLTNPVSITCGHSFCTSCIQRKWDTDAYTGDYSCPLCRQKFSSRPVLGQNIVLAEMVNKMKMMNLHAAGRQLAGPDDEQCYICTGEKCKAIKTCLVCLASYCEVHLNLHNELNPGNKHRVINATGKLEDKICIYHHKLKDMYCFEDQRSMQLKLSQIKVNQIIQRTENVLKGLQIIEEDFKRSTKVLEKDSEKTFEDLISYIRKQQFMMTYMIKLRKQKDIQRSDNIQKQLQMELAVLKNRADELNQLSCTEDDSYFLQRMALLCEAPVSESLFKITVNTSIFEDLKKSVSNMKTQTEQLCNHEMQLLKTDIQLIQTSTPVIREDFLRYFQPLTLDPNTVHKNLTHNNSMLIWSDDWHNYPDHPDRFETAAMALCIQGLTTCSYWEVEWGGPQVSIAVTYKEISRGVCCVALGCDKKSWGLFCNHSNSYFYHDSKEIDILEKVYSRIGVYLDYSEGILSFYNVSDTMHLIHQIKDKFSEPLYPCFWVFDGSYVKLCHFNENVSHQPILKGIKDPSEVKCSGLSQFHVRQYHRK